MAKLIAPLFSFGASGKLGDALVFFPWKGLNVVRSYVVPANPNTAGQQAQRGYMRDIVDDIHESQADATRPLGAADIVAYRALAGIQPTPRTWFNELVKQCLDQLVDSKAYAVFTQGTGIPGANDIDVSLYADWYDGQVITAGDFWYGVTPTSMINSQVAVVVADHFTATIAGLTTGVKYFWQFRSTAHNDYDGCRSGIYYHVAA